MLTKTNPVRSSKLRDSARDEICTLQISGVCNGRTDTTVLCHLPSEGKATARKSDDHLAVFGCSDCHSYLDQKRLSNEDELFYTHRALHRTWARWIGLGLITIKGAK